MKPDNKKKIVDQKPKTPEKSEKAAPKSEKAAPKSGGLFIPNFEQKIKDSKGSVKKPKGKLARASKVRPFFLPPLNTNINLSKLKKEKVKKKKLARALVLPENYNLKDNYPIVICGDRNDPTTSQFQQYACGCCWAYAIATAVSDVFVVQNKYLTNPNLSWTYILSCYPNEFNPGEGDFPPSALCGGGDVPTALLWLQQKGLPSAMCVDYAWCLNDPHCTGTGTDTKDMNKGIPSCGCYNSGNFYRYKIKDVRRISLDDSNDQNPEQIMTIHSQIKQHLFVTGSMVGCFIVLENIVGVNPESMKTGDFKTSKNPEGVYLECVGVDQELKMDTPPDGNELDACIYKYENEEAVKPETAPDVLGVLGAHAVSIVGWGMAPVSRSLIRPDIERLYPTIKTSDKDPSMVMVPYWWVRNSWGVSFAEEGFFKMAAYPFNRVSCLDRSINIKTDGRSISAGGCVLFFPDSASRDSFEANDQKGRTQAATEGGGGGGGDKGKVETGHFEGANKGAELGKAVAYKQLSYLAADDVLPQIGTYQISTTPNPAQPQGGGGGGAQVNTFPPDESAAATSSTEPPATNKSKIIIIIGSIAILLVILIIGLYLLCRYAPAKCPGFLRTYFQPKTISLNGSQPPPSSGAIPRAPSVVAPSSGLIPRVAASVSAGSPLPLPPPAVSGKPPVVIIKKQGVPSLPVRPPLPPPPVPGKPSVVIIKKQGAPSATAPVRPPLPLPSTPGAAVPGKSPVVIIKKPGAPTASAIPSPSLPMTTPTPLVPGKPPVVVIKKPGVPSVPPLSIKK